MDIIHDWENGPEVLFIEGLDLTDAKTELMWMKPVLKEPTKTGTAYEETKKNLLPSKQNRGIFFEDIYTPLFAEASPTALAVEKILKKIKEKEFTLNSIFRGFLSTNGYNVLLSAYKNGDYYKPHRDSSQFTILIWLGKKNFEGGDLILNEFDYKIPYKENLITVFPSHYLHEVTKLKTKEKDFVRYCATAFIT